MATEITTFMPDNPVAVLTNGEQFDALLGRIRAEVEAHVPDLTTKKGRDAIKSLAYKVTRTKTALDEAGKELNAEKRKEIEVVDAVRRDVREKLDALAVEARKPLDEWEAAEAHRQSVISEEMGRLNLATELGEDNSSAHINSRIGWLETLEFDADIFQDSLEIAINAKSVALETLRVMLGKAVQAEADAAELAALRQREADRIEAERIATERAAQIEADRIAEENRAAEAEAAEAKRLVDIKAAEDAAAEAATAEAARAAQAEIDKANAETKRLQDAEDARKAEEDRIASETAAREADKAHRGSVMKAAKEAMMANGDITEDQARKIVLAIVAGEIPNTRINF